MRSPTPPTRVTYRDHALGALLAGLYLTVLLGTASDLAMSRDESFYVVAAERYGGWYELLFRAPSEAFERANIDRYWSYNNEHPALMKTVFALSFLADRKVYPKLREALGLPPHALFTHPSTAYRFGGMLSASLLLWVIYVFGTRAAGRRVGLFAACAFATLPRVFYHAHLDCFDVPITLLLTLTVYAYYRSLVRRRWAVWAGINFGLALATKHNAWLLPGVLLVHWAFVALHERARRKRGDRIRALLTPHWLIAMLTLGPLIFYGTWPYIWHDTVARVSAYVQFHMHHAYYNMEYFGVNYFRPPFPISYPFVMTLFTIPLTFSALLAVGLWMRARALLPRPLALKIWKRGDLRPDARATDVLWLGCALAPILVIALPSTPIFGGTKHWFPAYPFLMLFAGYPAVYTMIATEARLYTNGFVKAAPVGGALAFVLLLVPGLAETIHSHRFGLSHYTLAAGGVAGAADLGMNRQFWGFTTGSVAPFLKKALPDGGTVFLNDTTVGAFDMLKRDGHLPANIRPASSLSEADYVLVHHEKHMAEVDFQAWQAFGSVAPVHVLTYDGVPIISVYESPRHKSRRAQAPVRIGAGAAYVLGASLRRTESKTQSAPAGALAPASNRDGSSTSNTGGN